MHTAIDPKSPDWDVEAIVEQVWSNLDGRLPRSTIGTTVVRLLQKYDDAVIRIYVPLLVHREATELLRTAVSEELEAKFAVPDPGVFWRLQASDHLAGFALSLLQTKSVWDTYLDTDDRRLRSAGYSCRRRETSEGISITLKSLDRAEGALHRREEWELRLAANLPPVAWPDSPLRDRVLKLIGQNKLRTLFDLEQIRVKRMVEQEAQPVAEISLDSVSLVAHGQEHVFHELEVELLPGVPEETLAVTAACLQEEWHLQPEPQSKFERALHLLDAGPDGSRMENNKRPTELKHNLSPGAI
ncbi:MAG: CYTH domain-containing protein [Candidatus Promineifilaceae bacterium]